MAVLQAIGNFIYAVVNLLINFIAGVVQMVTIIPQSVTMLTYSLGYMPTILIGFATALVTVSVVYLVIGR